MLPSLMGSESVSLDLKGSTLHTMTESPLWASLHPRGTGQHLGMLLKALAVGRALPVAGGGDQRCPKAQAAPCPSAERDPAGRQQHQGWETPTLLCAQHPRRPPQFAFPCGAPVWQEPDVLFLYLKLLTRKVPEEGLLHICNFVFY